MTEMKFHTYSLVKGYDKKGRQGWKTYCLACSEVGAGYIYPCVFEAATNNEIPPRFLYSPPVATALKIGDRVQTTYEWSVLYSVPKTLTGKIVKLTDIGPLRSDRNIYVELDRPSNNHRHLWFNPIYLEKVE